MIKKFTKRIYVSGADEVLKKEELQRLGINAILNVAWEVDDPVYAQTDFVMVKVGLTDNDQNPSWLKNLAILNLRSLLDNGKTVLVHCGAGFSRSPYVAIRYIAETENRTIESVYKEFMSTYPLQIGISPLNYG